MSEYIPSSSTGTSEDNTVAFNSSLPTRVRLPATRRFVKTLTYNSSLYIYISSTYHHILFCSLISFPFLDLMRKHIYTRFSLSFLKKLLFC